jgi:hypothetical protein
MNMKSISSMAAGARVSHPQQPGLPNGARNSTGFGLSNVLRLRQPRSKTEV